MEINESRNWVNEWTRRANREEGESSMTRNKSAKNSPYVVLIQEEVCH